MRTECGLRTAASTSPIPPRARPEVLSRTDLTPLIDAARAGDEVAFRGLYRAIQPMLLRYLRPFVGDDAEDVASEVWLRVARDLEGFTGDGFRAWVLTVARNRAVDHVRQLRRRPTVATPVEELPDTGAGGDAGDGAAELMGTASAIDLVSTLPQEQAEAVLLRVLAGFDGPAAARMLDKRPGAVRMAASRGLRSLAQRLDRTA
jgi:RNA polymerase sigma-70 factor (ECF subfamily)